MLILNAIRDLQIKFEISEEDLKRLLKKALT
jgi:hypothetical protein